MKSIIHIITSEQMKDLNYQTRKNTHNSLVDLKKVLKMRTNEKRTNESRTNQGLGIISSQKGAYVS